MARTHYARNLARLRGVLAHDDVVRGPGEDDPGLLVDRWLVGSTAVLDPCEGSFYASDPTPAWTCCEPYWEALERAGERLGGVIVYDDDVRDVYFERPLSEAERILDAIAHGRRVCPVCDGPIVTSSTPGQAPHSCCRDCGADAPRLSA